MNIVVVGNNVIQNPLIISHRYSLISKGSEADNAKSIQFYFYCCIEEGSKIGNQLSKERIRKIK
jgi:hypothetical protein